MNSIPATITHVSSKGVQATYHRLSEPNPDDFIRGYDFEHEEHIYDEINYDTAIMEYEASKFIAWVENVNIQKWGKYLGTWAELDEGELLQIEIGMSCQVIETENNKVKIISL